VTPTSRSASRAIARRTQRHTFRGRAALLSQLWLVQALAAHNLNVFVSRDGRRRNTCCSCPPAAAVAGGGAGVRGEGASGARAARSVLVSLDRDEPDSRAERHCPSPTVVEIGRCASCSPRAIVMRRRHGWHRRMLQTPAARRCRLTEITVTVEGRSAAVAEWAHYHL
jgi:hypothetical protein